LYCSASRAFRFHCLTVKDSWPCAASSLGNSGYRIFVSLFRLIFLRISWRRSQFNLCLLATETNVTAVVFTAINVDAFPRQF
jgi:hypothetical protein